MPQLRSAGVEGDITPGAVVCAYLLSRLDSKPIPLGVSWLVLGVLVLAPIDALLKVSPPEMTATKKATVEATA